MLKKIFGAISFWVGLTAAVLTIAYFVRDILFEPPPQQIVVAPNAYEILTAKGIEANDRGAWQNIFRRDAQAAKILRDLGVELSEKRQCDILKDASLVGRAEHALGFKNFAFAYENGFISIDGCDGKSISEHVLAGLRTPDRLFSIGTLDYEIGRLKKQVEFLNGHELSLDPFDKALSDWNDALEQADRISSEAGGYEALYADYCLSQAPESLANDLPFLSWQKAPVYRMRPRGGGKYEYFYDDACLGKPGDTQARTKGLRSCYKYTVEDKYHYCIETTWRGSRDIGVTRPVSFRENAEKVRPYYEGLLKVRSSLN